MTYWKDMVALSLAVVILAIPILGLYVISGQDIGPPAAILTACLIVGLVLAGVMWTRERLANGGPA